MYLYKICTLLTQIRRVGSLFFYKNKTLMLVRSSKGSIYYEDQSHLKYFEAKRLDREYWEQKTKQDEQKKKEQHDKNIKLKIP